MLFVQSLTAQAQPPKIPEIAEDHYHFVFSEIPKHVGNDLKNSFWGPNGMAFLAASGIAACMIPTDAQLDRSFAGHPVFGKNFDDKIGLAVSPYTIAGASALTWFLGVATHQTKLTEAMESTGEALTISMIVTAGAKYSIRRLRPNGENYSMPSAHAAATFTAAAVLTRYYGLKAAIPAYAVASLTSFSRLDGGNHHLTDVLEGAILGTAVGLGTANFHLQKHANLLLVPRVDRNQAGLSVYKSF